MIKIPFSLEFSLSFCNRFLRVHQPSTLATSKKCGRLGWLVLGGPKDLQGEEGEKVNQKKKRKKKKKKRKKKKKNNKKKK